MEHVWDVLIFLVVLAELVFVHELGHFLAAKACGVYCDRFSIGMPPRLFGIRWGETDYCLGALPIGGYVRMAGQEDVPKSDEERKQDYGHVPPERWLINKPRWQQAIVYIAGPAMNMVLGVLLYGVVAAVGADVPESKVDNRIGTVEPGSPAAEAPMYLLVGNGDAAGSNRAPDTVGWKTGDRLVSVNGREVRNIQDVAVDAAMGSGRVLSVRVDRPNRDGTVARYLSPVIARRLNPGEHARFGVESFEAALISRVLDDMPAHAAGLEAGDIIVRANGDPVDAATFTDLVDRTPADAAITIEVQRGNSTLTASVRPKVVGTFKDISWSPAPDWGIYLAADAPLMVEEQAPARLAGTGLSPGDRIVKLDGEPAKVAVFWRRYRTEPDARCSVAVEHGRSLLAKKEEKTLDLTMTQLAEAFTPFALDAPPEIAYVSPEVSQATGLRRRDTVREIQGQPATAARLREMMENHVGESVGITVDRPAIWHGLLQRPTVFKTSLHVDSTCKIGVAWGSKMVFHRVPAADVIPEAVREGILTLVRTVRTVALMFTGGLSLRDVGGPVMIYQVTTEAARLGYSWLLEMTALISVNLCVFNLLPLPVLDGGHLALLGVEAVRRKPIDARLAARMQRVGLLLILSLFVFITANDIQRLISLVLP